MGCVAAEKKTALIGTDTDLLSRGKKFTTNEDDRFEALKSMLEAYPHLRGMYDENDENTQVLYIKNVTAAFCAFGKKPEITEF